MTRTRRQLCGVIVAAALLASACGGEDADTVAADTEVTADDAAEVVEALGGLRQVSATEGAELIASSDEIIVLDIRTPEELESGYIEGAVMIDFYEPDFIDQLALLDPDAEYVLYCNSGNRSGVTMPQLADLGFTNVAEIDGGIQAWNAAGLALEVG